MAIAHDLRPDDPGTDATSGRNALQGRINQIIGLSQLALDLDGLDKEVIGHLEAVNAAARKLTALTDA
ncbi:MAG: hypothetical protein K2Q10_11265, partial [Rhodospirillales bacterium]|nr:hypothetical protein [Rhodospirillales bacterium]